MRIARTGGDVRARDRMRRDRGSAKADALPGSGNAEADKASPLLRTRRPRTVYKDLKRWYNVTINVQLGLPLLSDGLRCG